MSAFIASGSQTSTQMTDQTATFLFIPRVFLVIRGQGPEERTGDAAAAAAMAIPLVLVVLPLGLLFLLSGLIVNAVQVISRAPGPSHLFFSNSFYTDI